MPAGNAVAVVDPLGNWTTAVYDAAGNRVAVVDPLGNTTTVAYDAAGQVQALTDPLNHTTTYGYDAAGRRTSTLDPLQRAWVRVYDAADNLLASVDPNGNRTTAVYDARRRPVATVDPLGNRATAVYDAAGNAIASVNPLGRTTTAVYDARRRPVATVDPLGNRATVVYDAVGNAVASVDPLGNRATTVYDARHRAVRTTDPLGGVTTVAYDPAGNPVRLTDPVGNTTTWAFDPAHQVTTRIDPLGRASTYAYDPAGRRAGTTDPTGRRIGYGYDPAGNRTTESWYAAGGGLTQTLTYTYDRAGNLATAQAPVGTYTLSYDARNAVVGVAEPFGLGLTFGYDPAGNRTGVQDSAGGVQTVTFDVLNRQTGVQWGGTGVTPVQLTRAFDPAGQPASVSRQKWSGMWQPVSTTTYAYDRAGRLAGSTEAGPTTPLATFGYAYDPASRLTAETANGAGTSYGYDAAGQVTAAGAATFSYDRNGNRTNPGYVTGAGNRLTADGVWTYTYDPTGAVSRKTDAAGNAWAYGYNNAGQLVSAAYTPAGSGSATQVGTYAYDAFGNQVEADATAGGSTTVTRVGLDGWDPAQPAAAGTENFVAWADLTGANTLTARRVFGPSPGAPAVGQTAAGAVSWYATDLRGSVRLVLDNSGSATNTTTYDAFGGLVSGARADRYGYTGQGWDGLTGLQANGNGRRAYDPRTSRWLQPDPLGFGAGDPNLYRHVGNAPTNWIDPSGLVSRTYLSRADARGLDFYADPTRYMNGLWGPGGVYDQYTNHGTHRWPRVGMGEDVSYALSTTLFMPTLRTGQFVYDLYPAATNPYYQPYNPYLSNYLNGKEGWVGTWGSITLDATVPATLAYPYVRGGMSRLGGVFSREVPQPQSFISQMDPVEAAR